MTIQTAPDLDPGADLPAARPPRRRRPGSWRGNRPAYVLLAPNLVLIGLFLLVPLGWALVISFQDRRAFGPGRWSGLDNLAILLSDGVFWRAFGNTAIFTALTVPLSIGLGLALALLLDKALPGRGVFRTIVYLPIALSTLVVSLIGLLLFDESVGMINGVLSRLGVGPVAWQSEGALAFASVVVMTLWMRTGFSMLVYLAALQDVDRSIVEAAIIDGAGPFARVRRVIVPSLRPTTTFLLVINLIWSFQVFDVVFVMTNGGPGFATTMLVTYAYDEGFGPARNFGYGATVGLVLLLLTLAATGVQLLRGRRRGDS